MNNKPNYHFFKNTQYAIEGLIHALKTEKSFKIELFFLPFVLFAIYLIEVSIESKLILVVTFFIILIAELLNSAVENVVDLVTKERQPLAKSAKDIGATAVMFSITLHVICWVIVLFF